jgi:hypothetical protein
MRAATNRRSPSAAHATPILRLRTAKFGFFMTAMLSRLQKFHKLLDRSLRYVFLLVETSLMAFTNLSRSAMVV